MPAKCSVFIATSLDGYIARGDGSIDWLDEANRPVPAGEDCGYGEFVADVDGGLTIQGFLAAGLIDGITVAVIPVLLGSGRPLFGPLPVDVHLAHESTTAFEFGFAQSRYRVVRRAAGARH